MAAQRDTLDTELAPVDGLRTLLGRLDDPASPPHATRRPRTSGFLATAAVATIALVGGLVALGTIGFENTTRSTAAVEAPWRSLPFDEATMESDVLEHAAARAGKQPDTRGEGGYDYIHTSAWRMSTEQTIDGVVLSWAMEEVDREEWHAADGSGRIAETRDGLPSSANGPYGPGELDTAGFDDALPTDRLERQLHEMGRGHDAAWWFDTTADIWRDQVVSPSLHSAILRILAQQNGTAALGTTKDRIGRTGIAVGADSSDGTTRHILVLDPSTGDLLAAETIALADGVAPAPVTPPVTVGYTVWIDSARVDDTRRP
ncbi:hypothetical protein [Rhodococcus rhodnii]|uniref:CU044_5270 family protein n=2 Tax=Rhodococcus rhodnii TaxID=38312 RepID=R7WTD3_9NOCA|nr:hypothetical protein [Rhodococcus rhodnii]EOM77389.1 hypothetical protein Rrhod_1258 [Rhodococcus rhodnii LMG 5362]